MMRQRFRAVQELNAARYRVAVRLAFPAYEAGKNTTLFRTTDVSEYVYYPLAIDQLSSAGSIPAAAPAMAAKAIARVAFMSVLDSVG